MIAQLTGTVAVLGPAWIVLEVQGVGFRLACPPATSAGLRPASQTTVFTSLVVREDSLTLFGFAAALERDTFEMLQLASGVGPRLALAVVSVLSPAQVVAALQSSDIATLIKVPGIGRKGAEKMIIELRDRVAELAAGIGQQPNSTAAAGEQTWREQVSAGLQGLGWSAKDADSATETVAHLVDEDPQVPLGRLMKSALASLARA